MMAIRRAALLIPGLLAAALLAGCASGPPRTTGGTAGGSTAPELGELISRVALAQVGQRYRYGGNGPDEFDCSGLVRFAHAAQGIEVPRTTDSQLRAAKPVRESVIRAGDVLFFRFEGDKVSHVAIYAGNGRFVHAPQSGRLVETRQLNDPWYRQRLVGAGRLY